MNNCHILASRLVVDECTASQCSFTSRRAAPLVDLHFSLMLSCIVCDPYETRSFLISNTFNNLNLFGCCMSNVALREQHSLSGCTL